MGYCPPPRTVFPHPIPFIVRCVPHRQALTAAFGTVVTVCMAPDPGTDPGTEDKMLLEQLLSDGPSTLVAKGSPASAPVEHVVSPTAADFGHLKSVMGNLTQNVYGAEAVASPPPIASLLRSDEQGAEIDGGEIVGPRNTTPTAPMCRPARTNAGVVGDPGSRRSGYHAR